MNDLLLLVPFFSATLSIFKLCFHARGWFEKFCAVTSAVRNARAEQGIPPKAGRILVKPC